MTVSADQRQEKQYAAGILRVNRNAFRQMQGCGNGMITTRSLRPREVINEYFPEKLGTTSSFLVAVIGALPGGTAYANQSAQSEARPTALERPWPKRVNRQLEGMAAGRTTREGVVSKSFVQLKFWL
jgi:hypothetical protein